MQERDPQRGELEQLEEDFEAKADTLIERHMADKRSRKDSLTLDEKKVVIKEMALASSSPEILRKLNAQRAAAETPVLHDRFDLSYYKREYALLIEDVALLYAENLMKKFRYANRLYRVAKLSELAEHLNSRVQARIEDAEGLQLDRHQERAHNDNIKLLSIVMDEIDEQMGKLKLTKIDINVSSKNEQVVPSNPAEIQALITDVLKKKFAHQLPASVDANFSEVSDYEKCGWGEPWTNMHYCRYHGEQCKVQTGEQSMCPFFLNDGCLKSKEWLEQGYVKNRLSVNQLAALAGCKEVSQKVVDYVRGKLKEHGVERPS